MENLTDRQAADAVRSRIDWKYALGLELTDAGFHYSVLSEFRQRLLDHEQETVLLDTILSRCREKGLLKGKNKQRTDSNWWVDEPLLEVFEAVGDDFQHFASLSD